MGTKRDLKGNVALGRLKETIRRSAPGWLLDRLYGLCVRWAPALASRSQLRMCHADGSVVEASWPDGYSSTVLSASPLPDGWIETLASAGIGVSIATWAQDFEQRPRSRVVTVLFDRQVIGTAGITTMEGWPAECCLLTWVGIRQEHHGRGLSVPLIQQCLIEARSAGFTTVLLVTDDSRTPAIRTYLRTGFLPCTSSWDWTQRPRWRAVLESVGSSSVRCRRVDHQLL